MWLSHDDLREYFGVGFEIVHKFGHNEAVGTSFEPISVGGIYQMPQPASATALRVKSGGNANDTAAGTGAREITLIGLDETGAEVSEAVATAGTSASSATTATFMRLYRAYVSSSGTYATTSTGSHSGNIVIENSGGGTDWATISSTDFARSQTEIAAYSVPLAKTAYVSSISMTVDSALSADVILFQRQSILDASAPYEAMRVVVEQTELKGNATIMPKVPYGPFPASTDLIMMAQATSSAEVDVDFEIVLI